MTNSIVQNYNEALDTLSQNLIDLNDLLIKFYQQQHLRPSMHAFLRIYYRYVGFLMVEVLGIKFAKAAQVAAKDMIFDHTDYGSHFAKLSEPSQYASPQDREKHLQTYLFDEPEHGAMANTVMSLTIAIVETMQMHSELMEPKNHSVDELQLIESILDSRLKQYAHSSFPELSAKLGALSLQQRTTIFMMDGFLALLGWLTGYMTTLEGDIVDEQLEKYSKHLDVTYIFEHQTQAII